MAQVKFIDLDPNGSTIHGWGFCDESQISAQTPGVAGGSIVIIPDDSPIIDGNQQWSGTAIVAKVLTLAEAKAKKITDLTAACSEAIITEFRSNALGSWNYYGSNDVDQSNMQRIALAGGQLMCSASADATTWALNFHTPAQGLQVLQDFGREADTARENLASKTSIVNAATTTDQVNAVTW